MKKKLLTLLFALSALFVLSTSAFANDVDYLNNNSVLRTGPGTGYSSICTLPSGLQVYRDSFNSDGSWVSIIYTDPAGNSLSGWTWAGNLSGYGSSYRNSGSTGSSAPAATPSQGTYYVTATHLNLRSSPSTSGSILTSMPYGTAVTYISNAGNGWANVAWGNYQGYCSTQYLSSSRPASTVSSSGSTNAVTPNNSNLIGSRGSNSHGSYVVKATNSDTPMYAGEGTDGVMIVVPASQYVEWYWEDGSGYAFCGYNGYYGFIAVATLLG